MKYKNLLTKKEVIVSDMTAHGVCNKTIHQLFVVFKGEGDKFSKVMTKKEFDIYYERVKE